MQKFFITIVWGVFFVMCYEEKAGAFSPNEVKSFIAKPPKQGKISLRFASEDQLERKGDDVQQYVGYEFRWNDTSLVLFEVPALLETNNQAIYFASGSSNGKKWEYGRGNLTFFSDSPTNEEDLGSFFVFKTLLHIGMQNLDPKSVAWDGIHFTAKLLSGAPVNGSLAVDVNNDAVTSIQYEVAAAFFYDIIMTYQTNGGSNFSASFPSEINIFGKVGSTGEKRHLYRFIITHFDCLSAVKANEVEPKMLFPKGREVLYSQAGISIPGQNIFVPISKEPNSSLNLVRIVLVAVMILSSVSVVVLMLMAGRKKTKIQNENR